MTSFRSRRGPPARFALLACGSAIVLGAACKAESEPDADAGADDMGSGGSGDTSGTTDPDLVDFACDDPAYDPGACTPGTTLNEAGAGAAHIDLPTQIAYAALPPSSGDHRPQWARWGEYTFLPPQRWLHNLEHGGVALLYHPCADATMVEALRELARARPEDDTGPFRWVLTPYPDLPTAVGVVAWEWTYSATCVNAEEIGAFIDAHYRQGPEDVARDGTYEERYIGR